MMKFIAYVLAFSVLLFIIVNDVQAMSCDPENFENNLKKADIIFMGKVTKRDSFNEEDVFGSRHSQDEPQCGSKVSTFEIYKTWKGHIQDNKTTVYSSDSCIGLGSYLRLNHLYIIFANTNSKELPVAAHYKIKTICDGTRDLFPKYSEDDHSKYIIELIQKLDKFPTNKD